MSDPVRCYSNIVPKDDRDPRRTLAVHYGSMVYSLTKVQKTVFEAQDAYAGMKTFDSPTYLPFDRDERVKLQNLRKKMLEAEQKYFAKSRSQ